MSVKPKTYMEDKVAFKPDRVSTGKHSVHGDTTIFHDVVIASEMIQPYPDGKALKSRDELEAYAWTVDGRWIIAGGHPENPIISSRDEVSGRTVNARYVKDLKDPKTGRPCRAGVRADVEVFNSKISPADLEAMTNGTKADVSIGFFFDKDDSPGTLDDGPFKGEAFDYVQRSMFHDHLAVAIDNGRCPSPFCGLGADDINAKVGHDPFGGFTNFSECEQKIKEKNPDLSDEAVSKICGKLKSEHEEKEDSIVNTITKKIIDKLRDELEEVKGMKDSKQEAFPVWWKSIDWKTPEYTTIFDNLSEEVRQIITDAGLCPHCDEKKPKPEEKKGYGKPEEGKKEDKSAEGKEIPKEAVKENPVPSELTEEEKKKLEEEQKKKLAQEEEDKKKKNCDALPTAPATPLPTVPGLDPRKVLERASKYIK